MSIISAHNFFLLFMGMVLVWFVVVIPYILMMHFLMPRVILDKYFKPPYFRDFEVAMFTGIPYAPMRTIMFMGAIVFPRMGKKRKLTEIRRDTPRWYRLASILFIFQLIAVGGGAIIILIGLVSYTALTVGTT